MQPGQLPGSGLAAALFAVKLTAATLYLVFWVRKKQT